MNDDRGFIPLFGWLETFWHNLMHGLAALLDTICQTALQQTSIDIEQELAQLGIQRYSDDFYHIAEGLKIMATAGRISIAPQHQEIEPYTPPEPLPRYEIVMVDDWESRYASDIPANANEKAVTPFLCDKISD